jgi:hypothetical protein
MRCPHLLQEESQPFRRGTVTSCKRSPTLSKRCPDFLEEESDSFEESRVLTFERFRTLLTTSQARDRVR